MSIYVQTNLPDGVYSGIWSSNILRWRHEGQNYWGETRTGVRGTVNVTFKVTNGAVDESTISEDKVKDDRRVSCRECAWRGVLGEVKIAGNPFDPNETITGCPQCASIDSCVRVCSVEGCWRECSCGTPTPEGYKFFCGEHWEKRR